MKLKNYVCSRGLKVARIWFGPFLAQVSHKLRLIKPQKEHFNQYTFSKSTIAIAIGTVMVYMMNMEYVIYPGGVV